MKAIPDFFSAHWVQVLGYTLLHSLWEAFIVVALLIILLRFVSGKSSNARYVIASLCMVIIVSLSVGTFVYLFSNADTPTHTLIAAGHLGSSTVKQFSSAPGIEAYFSQAKNIIQTSIPFFLTIWIIGTFLFSLRILTALFYVEKLKGRSVTLDNEWSQYIETLARQLNIKRTISLAESAAMQVPVVVGYLKPMILIPIGMCGSLSTAQLETIFLHEIMHIRRKDYLINLFQVAVEAVYFFNPFVWIISGIMKREREHCCDDAVVQLHGNATEYAHALATLEELRLSKIGLTLSLAENKNELLNRIKRLMEKSVKNYSGRERIVPALLLVIGVVCASWMSTQNKNENAIGPDKTTFVQDTVKKTKKKSSKVEKKKAEISSVKKDKKDNSSDSSLLDSEEFSKGYAWHFYQGPPPLPPGPPTAVMPDLPIPFAFDDYQFSLGYGNNWEEFNKQFEENFKNKFGDFYLKHEKDIQQMMEDAQAKVHGKFDKEWEIKMEEFSGRQVQWLKSFAEDRERPEKVMADQQEAFRKSAEDMQRKRAEHDIQFQEFEKSHREFERKMKAFGDKGNLNELKEELTKDGYLSEDEKIESIHQYNDSIEINGKKIKPEHAKKYSDLLNGC